MQMKQIDLILINTVTSAICIISLSMPWIHPFVVDGVTGMEILINDGSFFFAGFTRLLLLLYAIANCIVPFISIVFTNTKAKKMFMQLPLFFILLISIHFLQSISNSNTYYCNDNTNIFFAFFKVMQVGYWVALFGSVVLKLLSNRIEVAS